VPREKKDTTARGEKERHLVGARREGEITTSALACEVPQELDRKRLEEMREVRLVISSGVRGARGDYEY
jgi:hypothetical protein